MVRAGTMRCSSTSESGGKHGCTRRTKGLISSSGHGTQAVDTSGDEGDEDDEGQSVAFRGLIHVDRYSYLPLGLCGRRLDR
jgi:hypothetical protein